MIFVEVAQKDMLNLGVSANIPFIELKKTRKIYFYFCENRTWKPIIKILTPESLIIMLPKSS